MLDEPEPVGAGTQLHARPWSGHGAVLHQAAGVGALYIFKNIGSQRYVCAGALGDLDVTRSLHSGRVFTHAMRDA